MPSRTASGRRRSTAPWAHRGPARLCPRAWIPASERARRRRHRPPGHPGSERGDVLGLRLDGVRGLAQSGQLALGEVALDDPADAGLAQLRLDAEVDTVDAVLAVDPGADR